MTTFSINASRQSHINHCYRLPISIAFSFVLFVFTVAKTYASSFTQLHIVTEDYAPMNYFEKGQFKGISIEILREIWKLEGIAYQPEVILYPWARAFYELQQQPNFLLFSVAKTKSREALFKWACPIYESEYILIAKKRSRIRVNSVEELTQYTIGTVRHDISDLQLKVMLPNKKKIISKPDMKLHLDLMDRGRLELIAYDAMSAASMLKKAGRIPEDFEKVFTISQYQTCFAFSAQTSSEIVDRFNQHLSTLIENGTYQKIINKYKPPEANLFN